jgi:hypothetical protein
LRLQNLDSRDFAWKIAGMCELRGFGLSVVGSWEKKSRPAGAGRLFWFFCLLLYFSRLGEIVCTGMWLVLFGLWVWGLDKILGEFILT